MHQTHIIIALFEVIFEFAGQVHQVSGFHNGTTVELALAVEVGALQELLVVHYNDLLFSLTHDCTTGSKRHIPPLNRAQVDNSITRLEFVCYILWEWAGPEGEPLHKNEL